MRWISLVASLLCSVLPSLSLAQGQALPQQLAIRSENLPYEERALMELYFVCPSCDATEIHYAVQQQVGGLGYVKAVVSAPTAVTVESGSGRFIRNTVTVDAGRRYYMGNLAIFGSKSFPIDQLKRAVLLQSGMVFSTPLLGTSLENLRQLYAGAGLRNMTAAPILCFDETRHVINLTLDINEE